MDLLEANLASTPPEEEVRLGSWRLRRSTLGGRREGAAILCGPLEPDSVEAAIGVMRGWRQRPVFQVREGERRLDAVLETASLRVEATTALLAADAAAVAMRRGDLVVTDCAGPIAIMTELWVASAVDPARQAALARVQGPRRYLLGRVDDRPAGAAFVSRHGPAAVVNALFVAPGARRRGLARRMLQWAAGWGAEQGASHLALAVGADNAAALSLCRTLGMGRVGGYHYRAAT
jgi:N-acetylglutamate synthase